MKKHLILLAMTVLALNVAAQYTDITMRNRPLWVVKQDKTQNRFVVVSEETRPNNLSSYNRMIFKPHVGNVRLTGKASRTEQGDYQATFALDNPKLVAKMFRGYNDSEMAPIIVTADFLNTHLPLQFSRWKEGEQKRELTNSRYLNLLKKRYPEWRIQTTQWLASIGDERDFYLVVFKPTPRQALASLVCFAQGELVSALDHPADIQPEDERTEDGKPMHVWAVCDYGEYSVPEIMAFMATDKGLEMYVRQWGSECYGYTIYRENERGGWNKISQQAVSVLD